MSKTKTIMPECPETGAVCKLFDPDSESSVNDKIDGRVYKGLDKRIGWQIGALTVLIAVLGFFYSESRTEDKVNIKEIKDTLRVMSSTMLEVKYMRKDIESNRKTIERITGK